jgi:hypothetical protein
MAKEAVMNERRLASLLAKMDGGKSEARIGEFRECVKNIQLIIASELYEEGASETLSLLMRKFKRPKKTTAVIIDHID